jgi:hypothetical protein
MKNIVVWGIIILILVAGIFWYMNRQTETPLSLEDAAQESSVVTLSAQNDSGMSGVATLTGMNGNTFVELNLTGAPVDVTQPAHIHTGSCADIGGVVYPLIFPVNGISQTTLTVPLDTILANLPLALNVHKSAAEASVYVACGDLK